MKIKFAPEPLVQTLNTKFPLNPPGSYGDETYGLADMIAHLLCKYYELRAINA
jgi:hypothetical protein